VAIKHFQDNWDIDAPDFVEMLERAFAKQVNLLAGNMYYPLRMLVLIARQHSEGVRGLFKMLYDETIPVNARIEQFKSQMEQYSAVMQQTNPSLKNSFQEERAICVYLAFKYPENHFLFKPTIYKSLARLFEYQGDGTNRENYYAIMQKIRDVIDGDSELTKMSQARLVADCYQDPRYSLLATDVGYYAFNLQKSEEEARKPPAKPAIASRAYDREKFLDEVFMTADDYDSLINLLIRKRNLILQGAPGVGKTFAAKRLVYSLIGEKNSERICFVQFHQSYGYEDFVMGYRPIDSGFALHDGVFYSFCKEAAKDAENDWYFIIDEINRGNISKIFGELLMLVEADKRGKDYAVHLQGAKEQFFIPENVYIIGMMNTADRSIALIDYALRRRFAFYTLEPAFDKESFRDYMESKNSEKYNKIIELVSKLNEEIANDPLLGAGFKIGHSYFCTDDQVDGKLLHNIILYEIKPLLLEYWIDDTAKVQTWTAKLLEAAQ
jgi:hypothetical protein